MHRVEFVLVTHIYIDTQMDLDPQLAPLPIDVVGMRLSGCALPGVGMARRLVGGGGDKTESLLVKAVQLQVLP